MTSVQREKKILVTGFGAFRQHAVNPSSEIAKKLDGECFTNDKTSMSILSKTFQVDYDEVKSSLPTLLADLDKSLAACVHIGVGSPGFIKLEIRANNKGHVSLDVNGKKPELKDNCCILDGPEQILTSIDLESILSDLKKNSFHHAKISDDAGTYLCNFIYYLSQYSTGAISNYPDGAVSSHLPTLFVHIPPVVPESQPYSLDEIYNALKIIIQNIVNQITSSD